MDAPSTRKLRSDARENRDRVLDAARELFSESGLAVTMREVARRAGVGPATLYRRFPTKQDLVVAAFADELQECRGIVMEGARDLDAWGGFSRVITRIVALNARNQGFTEAFLSEYPGVVDFAAHRAELLAALAGLVRRAQAGGMLRGDFAIDDFVLVLTAGRGLAVVPAETRAAAAHRYASLALESFRASPENGPLAPRARLVTDALRGTP